MEWYTVVNSAGATWEIRANSEQEARDKAEAMIPYESLLLMERIDEEES